MTNPVSVPRELLPCPFCGNDLQVSQHRYNPWARCVTENCKGAQLPLLNIELPEDVERWNRRAAPVAAPSQDDVGEPTLAMVQAACAAFRMDIGLMEAMHAALIAAHQHEQEKGDE